jgi:hypothetical protein
MLTLGRVRLLTAAGRGSRRWHRTCVPGLRHVRRLPATAGIAAPVAGAVLFIHVTVFAGIYISRFGFDNRALSALGIPDCGTRVLVRLNGCGRAIIAGSVTATRRCSGGRIVGRSPSSRPVGSVHLRSSGTGSRVGIVGLSRRRAARGSVGVSAP